MSAFPRLRVKTFVASFVAILATGVAGRAYAQTRQGTINIAITVPSAVSAHVEEQYALRSSLPLELRLLARPCATIENLRVERAGIALNVVRSQDGPWITLRDTTPSDSLPRVVRYDVRLTGTGIIPIVHLAAPLARNRTARLGAVSIGVRLPDDAGRVAFPYMTRQAPSQWSARYVAVPSFVEIAGDAVKECVEPADETGDSGGLVWRFFLLVGIMVAWVPLYLAWARRSGESA